MFIRAVVLCLLICAMSLPSARTQASDASKYMNESLAPFFSEMHHEIVLDRGSQPELCPAIAGNFVFTPKSVRVLTFDNRGPEGSIAVDAWTDGFMRTITLSHGDCRLQFQIFRMENTSDGEKNILPFDGSGIPGAEKLQVSFNKSIIDAAAYFPESHSDCGLFSVPFSDDRVGLRILTSGYVPAKIDFTDFARTPGKKLTITRNGCKSEIFTDVLRNDGVHWIDDVKQQ